MLRTTFSILNAASAELRIGAPVELNYNDGSNDLKLRVLG